MRPHLVLGLAVVVACGSFSDGDDPPAPGGPDAGNGTVDASEDTADAGPPDEDTGAPADDGGIPPARPCDQMLLCDGFERDEVIDVRWNDLQEMMGGTLSISTMFNKSPTRSLAVALPPAATDGREAYLRKTVLPKARRLTARFWLRTLQIPADGDILFAEVTTEGGQAFLMFQSGKLVLSAQSSAGSSAGKTDTLLPVGMAHEIVFDYRGGTTSKAILLVDGTELELPIGASVGGGDATAFKIGATFARPSNGAAAYFIDEVSIDRGF